MLIDDYINFIDGNPDTNIKGFTIGKGKKIYWYITPMPNSGRYRCLPIEKDGKLGWPRMIYPNMVVHIVYEKDTIKKCQ